MFCQRSVSGMFGHHTTDRLLARVRRRTLSQIIVFIVLSLVGRAAFAQTPTRWKFMVTGDSRGSFSEVNTMILSEIAAEAVREMPDLFLFTGDMAYTGGPEGFAAWKNAMADVYDAGIRVLPVMGNHEANDPESFEEFFGADMPDNGPAEQLGRTYFVAHKNALVLGLDQFTSAGVLDQDWIESVLATNKAPHVFAMGHMPAFKALHDDCLDDWPDARDAFWNALKSHGCRAYFVGHDHFYDHMRVDDGDDNPENDVHQFIVGTAGAPLYPAAVYDGDNTAWIPLPVFHDQSFGYLLVEIDGSDVMFTWRHRTAPGVYESADPWTYNVHGAPRLNIERTSPFLSRMWFATQPSVTYIVEHSTDLKAWAPIATNRVDTGRMELTINSSTNGFGAFRVRAERVVPPPPGDAASSR